MELWENSTVTLSIVQMRKLRLGEGEGVVRWNEWLAGGINEWRPDIHQRKGTGRGERGTPSSDHWQHAWRSVWGRGGGYTSGPS